MILSVVMQYHWRMLKIVSDLMTKHHACYVSYLLLKSCGTYRCMLPARELCKHHHYLRDAYTTMISYIRRRYDDDDMFLLWERHNLLSNAQWVLRVVFKSVLNTVAHNLIIEELRWKALACSAGKRHVLILYINEYVCHKIVILYKSWRVVY